MEICERSTADTVAADLDVEVTAALPDDSATPQCAYGSEEEVVDAGDEAVRLGGSGIHVGVVRVGDQVYTLLVPADDAEPAAIETLIATMATTLG